LWPLVHFRRSADEQPAEDGRRAALATRVNFEVKLRRARELHRQLEAARVACLFFKGLPLAAAVYRDPAERPMTDVDALVRARDFARALAVLEREGHRVQPPTRSGPHAAQVVSQDRVTVDRHFRLSASCRLDLGEELWQKAVPFDERRGLLLAPCPAHHLAIVLAHGAFWSINARGVWVADALALLERHPALDWSAFADCARSPDVRLALLRCLDYLKQRFGVSPDENALEALRSLPVPWFERCRDRAASRAPGSRTLLDRAVLRLAGLRERTLVRRNGVAT
jgi:hypothetical protein